MKQNIDAWLRYYEHGRKLDSWQGKGVSSDPAHHVEAAFPVPSFSNVLEPPSDTSASSGPGGGGGTNEWKQRDSAGSGKEAPAASVIPQLVSTTPAPAASDPGDLSSSASSDRSGPLDTGQALEALSRHGLQLQQVTVPRDLSIPTGPTTPPVHLKAGDKVMVIRTVKGENQHSSYNVKPAQNMNITPIRLYLYLISVNFAGIYLRMGEKIIKIKQLQAVQGLFGEN